MGRQQSVPVRGGENRQLRRIFRGCSFLGAGECGTRAGDTPGEKEQNQSSTDLAWPLRRALLFGDCTTFLWNITAFNGMWLVTLLLLYSLQEGRFHFSVSRMACSSSSPLSSEVACCHHHHVWIMFFVNKVKMRCQIKLQIFFFWTLFWCFERKPFFQSERPGLSYLPNPSQWWSDQINKIKSRGSWCALNATITLCGSPPTSKISEVGIKLRFCRDEDRIRICLFACWICGGVMNMEAVE